MDRRIPADPRVVSGWVQSRSTCVNRERECPNPAILQLDDRFLRALRNQTVPAPDRCKAHVALFEVLFDRSPRARRGPGGAGLRARTRWPISTSSRLLQAVTVGPANPQSFLARKIGPSGETDAAPSVCCPDRHALSLPEQSSHARVCRSARRTAACSTEAETLVEDSRTRPVAASHFRRS